ncbi:MAG: hypothetical protein J6B93_02490 [Clostridia bacterium]|nr:hypothetical protein [Clostridia bacterium]
MRGQNTWSYRPYKPLLWNVGDIYICRVVPYTNSITLEWLGEDLGSYSVFFRKRNEGDFSLAGVTEENAFTILGLDTNTDYEFYVSSENKKSRTRLAHTGEGYGITVNYLHPEDEAYSFSGRYLCSPSMVRHPEGFLLASCDLYGPGHPQNLTLIFRSDDNGASWHYLSELMPCFWGKLFIHRDELYMLACTTEYGDLVIGRSLDGGRSFSAPVTLLRGSGGKNGNVGVHKNPQNIIIKDGRLWNTMEWGSWANSDYYHAVMVMSCGIDDDLLNPESWHFSEPVKYDPQWEGTVNGVSKGNIEGTLTVAPDGNLYNIMRYSIVRGEPPYGLVLAYKVNTEDPDAPLAYSHSIKMPCNESKFTIKFDDTSGKYYSVATRIDCEKRKNRRSLLSLLCSTDLENWCVVCDLADYRDEDDDHIGFQYCDFEFDGDDLIYLCRTAINGANSFHDSNYLTFHRIKNFRNI